MPFFKGWGKPGIALPSYLAQQRNIWYSGREKVEFCAPPITIDGVLSSNVSNYSTGATVPANTYGWTQYLWAGQPIGRETGNSTNKWRTSIIDNLTVTGVSGASTFTISVAGALELQRLFNLGETTKVITGPPTATGIVANQTVTISSINTTTGVVTITGTLAANYFAGSIVQPPDGSATILTVIGDPDGLYCTDPTGVTRLDQYESNAPIGGGTINTGVLVGYANAPASLQTYIKAAINKFAPSVTFLDNIVS